MQIQLLKTLSTGATELINLRLNAGYPVRIKAEAGSKIAINIDGVTQTGNETVAGKKPVLKKMGKDLAVQIDGETVAEITDFYATPSTTLEGTGWTYSATADALAVDASTGGLTAVDQATRIGQEATAASTGISGGERVAAIFAGISAWGIAATSSGSKSGNAGAGPIGDTTINGFVAAGPLVLAHGLSVTLLRPNGTVLVAATPVNPDGTFSLTFSASYTGPVLARVVDASTGVDYMDEATRTALDLRVDLRAALVTTGAGTYTLTISPLTELVVRQLGLAGSAVDADGTSAQVLGSIGAAQINAANSALATALGLGGSLFVTPALVVNASGAPNPSANMAGYLLAAISGLETLHGSARALDYLTSALASGVSAGFVALVIAGAREAGFAASTDYVATMVGLAPASAIASAVSAAAALTGPQLAALDATSLAALSPAVLAALTTAQIGLIPSAAAAGYTDQQLHALNSQQLAQLAAGTQLSLQQAQALSTVQLDALFELPTFSFITTDDEPGIFGAITPAGLTNDATPTLTGTLAAKLPTGAEVAVYDAGVKIGTATVAGDRISWSFTSTALADGSHGLTVRIEVPGGQSSVQSAGLVFTVDATAPTIAVQAVIASNNVVNAAEKAAGVTVSGVTTGVEDGRTVTVDWGGSIKTAVVTGGIWSVQFTAVEVPADAVAVPLTATVSDMAGNAAVSATRSITVDTVAPTIAITANVATDNIVNAVEKAAGVTLSGTTTGVEDGQVVTLTWGATTTTAVVAGNAWSVLVPGAQVPPDAASTTITATVRDAAGNPSTPATHVVAIDTAAPTIAITSPVSMNNLINMAEATAGVSVTGTTSGVEDGQTVTVVWGAFSTTAVVTGGAWAANFASGQTPPDGASVALTASVSDAAGNPAVPATHAVAIDTAAPTIAFNAVANDGTVNLAEKAAGVVVSGTTSGVEDGQLVSVTWGTSTKNVAVSGNAWAATFASGDIPADSASSPISASVQDASGNPSAPASTSVVIDTTVPSITIADVTADNIVNAAEKAAGVTVSGTTTLEVGRSITLAWGSTTKTITVAAGGTWTASFNGAELPADAANTLLTADGLNAALTAAQQAQKFVTIDTAPPAAPVFALASDTGLAGDGVSSVGTITVGGLESGATWQYSVDSGATWTPGIGTSFALPVSSYAVAAVQVRQIDQAGNTGVAAQNAAAIVIDATAPTLAITSDKAALKGGETALITFTFSEAPAGFGASDIAVGNGTISGFTATANPAVFTAIFTPTPNLASGVASISVAAGAYTDVAGISGAAGSTPAIVFDTLAPTVAIATVATDNIVNAAEKVASVTVSGTTTDVENGQTVTVVWGAATKTATVTGNSWSVNFLGSEVPADAASTAITANVSDQAGNAAAPATRTVRVDTAAPTVAIATVATDNIVNATEKAAGVTVSGTTTGVEDGQTVSVTWGSASKTAVVTGNTWSVLFSSAEVPADSASTTVSASVNDAAGNVGQVTRTVAIDTNFPSINIANVATDDIVNAAEKAAGVLVSGTTTLENGRQITLVWGATTKTATVSSGTWSTIFLPSEVPADAASSTMTANGSSIAGNPAIPANKVVAIDTTAPILSQSNTTAGAAVSLAEATAVAGVVSVTAESGSAVSVTLTGTSGSLTKVLTGTGSAQAVTLSAADVAALGQGAVGVSTTATDVSGSSATVASGADFTLDTTLPTLAITSDKAALKAGETATITFSFSEDPGASFVLADVTVAGGTLGAISGSGLTRTATFTPAAGSTTPASISVASSTFTDAAGNANADGADANNTVAITIDTALPTLAITSDKAALKAGETATITFAFSEDPGASFVLADITVVGGTLGAITGSGLTRTATFTPAAGSTTPASISVASSTFTDAAGNANADGADANNTVAITIDTALPTLAITSDKAALKAGETATVTFSFSEDPGASFVLADVTVAGGTLGTISGSGLTRTATFTPAAGSTTPATISVASATFTDAAGNANADGADADNTVAITIDTVVPTVTAVAISSATGAQNNTLNVGDVVTATVTFTEAVDVTGAPQLALNIGGTTVQAVYAGGSGSTALTFSYTIAPGQTDANGISVAANALALGGGTIADAAGNAAVLTHAVVADNSGYLVDTQAPTVTITNSAGGATVAGNVTYTFDFSEAVTGFDASDVTVTNGSKGAFTAVSATRYTLVVTPTPGTTGADLGVSLATTLTDLAGTPLAAVANASPVAWDVQGPSVTSVALTSSNKVGDRLRTGDTLTATVSFSEDVTVTGGPPTLGLTIGGAVFQASYAGKGAANELRFNYVIVTGQSDDDGISIPTNALAGNGVVIADALGNVATLSHAGAADNAAFPVGTLTPAPTIGVVAGDDVISADEVVGTVVGGVTLAGSTVQLNVAGVNRAATVTGTSWSYTLTATDIANIGQATTTLTAVATDNVGNVSAATQRVITVDTAIANRATVATVTDSVGIYTGPLATNTSTDDNTLDVAGTLQTALLTNEVVGVYNGATRLGTADVTGTNWTYAAVLSAGTHSLGFRIENTATGVKGPSSTPVVVAVNGITLTVLDNVGATQGLIGNGFFTDDARPSFAGRVTTALRSGEQVGLYDTVAGVTTRVGTAIVTADGLSWSFDPSADIALGPHTYTARIESTAAIARVVSGAVGFNYDDSAAVVNRDATLTNITDSTATNGSATGTVAAGTSTDASTLLLSGALSGALAVGTQVLAIYDTLNGVTRRLGYASVGGTTWTYNAGGLAAGLHSFVAQVESLATGAPQGLPSTARTALVQTLAFTMVDDFGTLQGPVVSGGTTDDTTPTLSGTLGAPLAAGEVVRVYDGTTLLGPVTLSGTSWTFTPSAPLPLGARTLNVVVQDSAGSAPAGSRVVSTATLNVVAVAAPTTTTTIVANDDAGAVTTYVANFTGALAAASSTDDNTPTFSGTLSAALGTHQVVQVFDGSTLLGNANVSGLNWTYAPAGVAAPGSHNYKARVFNTGTGQAGAESSTIVQVGALGLNLLSVDSGSVANTPVRYVLVKRTGNYLFLNELEVFSGGVNIAQGKAATAINVLDTRFSAAAAVDGVANDENIASGVPGSARYYASSDNGAQGQPWLMIDLGGLYSFDSLRLTSRSDRVWIDNTAIYGSAQDISALTLAQLAAGTNGARLLAQTPAITPTQVQTLGTDTGVITVSDATPLLSGELQAPLAAGEVVKVYVDGVAVDNATVTPTGWSYTLAPLAVGSHTYQVKLEDGSGNVRLAHPVVGFKLVVGPPSASVATLVVTDDRGNDAAYGEGNYTGALTSGSSTDDTTPLLSGTLTAALGAGELLQIYDGANLLGNATVTGTNWSYQTSAQSQAGHAYSARVFNPVSGQSSTVLSADLQVSSLGPITFTVNEGEVAPGGVRYVLLKQNGASTNQLYVNEIQVFSNGVNVALGKPATAGPSSTYGGYSVVNVNNGTTASDNGYAAVAFTSDNWIMVDLGNVYAIDSLSVFALSAGPGQWPNIRNVDVFGALGDISGLTYAQLSTDASVVRMGRTGATPGFQTEVPASNMGQYTLISDTTPVIGGTLGAPLGAGELVKVYLDGAAVGNATVNGTRWSYALAAQSLGNHALKVTVEDAGGNIRFAQAGKFAVQSGAAPTAVVSTLVVTDDSGIGNAYPSGNYTGALSATTSTDDITPVLSGTLSAALDAGQVVRVFDGSTLLGAASVTGTSWTFRPVAQAIGQHAYSAQVVNPVSGLGTAAVPAVNINIISLGAVSTGTSGNAVAVESPTLGGSLGSTLANGEVVRVYVDGAVTGQLATVVGSAWSVTLPAQSVGAHTVKVQVEDAGGAVRLVQTGAFSRITTVPTSTVATLVVTDDVGVASGYASGNYTGVLATGQGTTDDTTPTLTGTLSAALGASEVVQVYDGNTLLGNASVSDTNWSYQTGAQAAGGHSYRVQVTNTQTSLASTALSRDLQVGGLGLPTVSVDSGGLLAGPGASARYVLLKQTGASTNPLFVNEIQVFSNGVNVALGKAVTAGPYPVTTVAGPPAYSYPASGVTNGSLARENNNGYAAAVATTDNWVLIDLGAVFSIDSLSVYALGGGDTPFLRNTMLFGATTDISGLSYSQLLADAAVLRLGFIGAAPLYQNTRQGIDFSSYTAIVSDTTPTVSGTLGAPLGAGEVVKVYVDGAAVANAVVSGTTWSYTLASQSLGSHAVRVQVESAGGAVGLAQTTNFTVVSAAAPGQTVSLSAVSELVTLNGSRSGVFASDSSTDGSVVSMAGSLSAVLGLGDSLVVYDGTRRLGTATVSGTGWTYVTNTLTNGVHALSARVENSVSLLAGAASPDFLVRVSSLGISSLYDNVGDVQGNVFGGGVTDDTTPLVSGTLGTPLASGEVIAIFATTSTGQITKLGNAVVNSTGWQFPVPAGALVNGTYSLVAAVQSNSDLVLNPRLASAALAFTVVTQGAPTAVATIVSVNDHAATNGSVTGPTTSGLSIDTVNPVLSGSLTASLGTGENVVIFDGNARLGVASVTGLSWISGTPALAAGVHSLTARVVNDGTGQSSAASAAFVLRVGSVDVSRITDNEGAVLGVVAAGGVTDDATPTLSGALGAPLGAGEVVRVYDGSTLVGTAAVTGGNWSVTTSALAIGNHTLSVVVQDGAATTLANSRVVSVSTLTVAATTAPTTTTSLVVTDDVGSATAYAAGNYTGALGANHSTDDRTPTFSGTLSVALGAGEVVQVFDGSTLLGNATMSGNSWTYQTTAGQTQSIGSHGYRARVFNQAAGLAGADATATVQIGSLNLPMVSVDSGQIAGVARYIMVRRNTANADLFQLMELQVMSGGVNVARGKPVTLSQAAASGFLPEAAVDGSAATFVSTSSGTLDGWIEVDLGAQYAISSVSVTPSAASSTAVNRLAGAYVFAAQTSMVAATQAQLLAGGVAGGVLTVGQLPINLTSTTPQQLVPPQGVLAGLSVTDTTPTVSGQLGAALGAGEQVKLYVDGVAQPGTATVTGTGWTYPLPVQTPGAHTLRVQVEGTDGSVRFAQAAAFTVAPATPPGSAVQSLTLNDDYAGATGTYTGALATGSSTDDSTPTLRGTLSVALGNGEVVQVYDGASLLGNATVVGLNWSYQPGVQAAGSHAYTVKVSNAAGVSSASMAATAVVNGFGATSVTVDQGSVGDGPRAVRYVLLKQTGASTNLLYVNEIQVVSNGVNVALGKAVTAGPYLAIGGFPGSGITSGSLLRDGNNGYAASVATNDNWLQVDLGALYSIESLSVYALTAAAVDLPNIRNVQMFGAEASISNLSYSELMADTAVVRLGATGAQPAYRTDMPRAGFAADAPSALVTDTTPSFSGSLKAPLGAGEVLRVYVDGQLLGPVTVTGTSWQYTVAAQPLGTHEFRLSVEDVAGNVRFSQTGSFTVAATGLPSTLVTSLVATDDSGTASGYTAANYIGALANDSSTDDNTPRLGGTLSAALAAGEVVRVYDGATLLGTASVTGTNWAYQTGLQAAGVHQYTARVENTATGLQGAASAATTVRVGGLGTPVVTADTGTPNTIVTGGGVRYVLLKQTGASTNSLAVNEIEVYANGANVALGKSVSYGTYIVTGDGAVVTSGNKTAGNGWAGPPTNDTWAMVDLGAAYNIDSVVVYPWVPPGTLDASGADTFETKAQGLRDVQVFGSASSAFASLTYAELMASSQVARLGQIGAAPLAANVMPSSGFANYQQLLTTVGATTDNTPTVSGTLGALLGSGETVKVYVDGALAGTATVTGTSWSYTLPEQPAGDHALRVQVEGPGGEVRFAQSSNILVSPAALVPAASVTTLTVVDDAGRSLAYADGNFTGTLAAGSSTDDSTPTLGGTLSAALGRGEVVQVFDGATLLGNATVLGTTWSYQTAAQTVGSHSYSARVTSQAWNLSSAAQSQTVQVNSLSPVTLSVDSGQLSGGVRYVLLKQSGVNTNELWLNEIQVFGGGVNLALGKAVTTSSATLYGGFSASAVTDGDLARARGYASNAPTSGNWVMVDLGAAYAIDTVSVYALSSSAGDLPFVGNVQLFGSVKDISGLSNAQLLVDTGVARLGALGAAPAYRNDMPASGFENYTLISDSTPTLSGTLGTALGAGEVLKVYVDGIAVGNATVAGTNWSYGLAALATGSHAYRVQLEGADGSVRLVRGGNMNVTSDVAPTAAVTGIAATDDSGIANAYAAGNYTGVLAAGSSTDDNTPTLSGTLSAALGVGEVVQVFDGATLLGSAAVNGTGWTFQTAAQAAGAHNYSARVVNLASGLAGAAQSVALSVGGLALTSLIADSGPLQGNLLATGGRTSDTTPVLAGTLASPVAAGERLAIYVDGVFSGNATISGLTWFYTPSSALSAGAHVLNVRLEDIATGSMRVTLEQAVEVVSAATVPGTVVDGVIRFVDNVSGGIYASGNQTGTLAANVSTDDTTPTLSGQISAPLKVGEVVQVLQGGVVLGTATVSGTAWSFTPAALATGSYSFSARVLDTGTGSVSAAQGADIVVQSLAGFSITPQSGTAQTGAFVRYVLVQQAAVSTAEPFDVGYVRVWRNGTVVSELPGVSWTTSHPSLMATSINGTAAAGGSTAYAAGVARAGYTTASAVSNGWIQVDLGALYPVDSIDLGNTDSGAWLFASAQSLSGNTLGQLQGGAAGAVTLGQLAGATATLTTASFSMPAGVVTAQTAATLNGTLGTALHASGNERVGVYVDGAYLGNATVSGTSWSYSVAGLSAGPHTVRVTIEDAGTGAIKLAQSQTLTVVAATPTATATISLVNDDVGAAIGALASGAATDDRQLALSGQLSAALDAGEVLQVLDGATVLGTATVTGTGWTYTTPSLVDGNHALSVRVRNTATGSNGSASTPFNLRELNLDGSVTVDSGTVSQFGVRYVLLKQTGASTNQLFVNEIEVYANGVNVALGKSVKASAYPVFDGYSLASGVTNGIFTRDGNNGLAHTPSTPDNYVMVDLGAEYAIDSVSAYALGGNPEDPPALRNVEIFGARTDISALSYAQLLSASHVTSLGKIGENPSYRNDLPTAVSVPFVYVSDTTPTVSGVLGAALTGSERLAVYDVVGGVSTYLGNATVTGANGAWTYTPLAALAQGQHTLRVRLEDTGSGAVKISKDEYVSIASVATQSASVLSVQQGMPGRADAIVSGSLSASLGLGQEVAVYDGAILLGYATASGTGWSFSASGLGLGSHTLSARVFNADGTASTGGAGSTQAMMVSGTAPTQTVTVLGALETAGAFSLAGKAIANTAVQNMTVLPVAVGDSTPGFFGKLSSALGAGESLVAFDGATEIAGTAAVSGLSWNFVPTAALADGYHTLTFGVKTGSNYGAPSTGWGINLDAVVDNKASITSLVDDVGAVTGRLVTGGSSDDGNLVMSGRLDTVQAGTVKLFDGATEINSLDLGLAGASTWSLHVPTLSAGAHTLSVKFYNTAGVEQAAVANSMTVNMVADANAQLVSMTTSASGIDTATLTGPGQALDFTRLGSTPVDRVALGSFGGNSVRLSHADVLDAGTGLFTSAKGWTFSNSADNVNSASYHQLVVSGSGTPAQGDSTVALASAAGTMPWALTGTATQGGTTYNVYTNLATDNAQLIIDQALKVNTAVL